MVKPVMTWVASRKGWMKDYQGKMYAISAKKLKAPPTKEGSVAAANEWWRKKQAEIDNTPPPPPDTFHQKQQRGMATYYLSHGQDEDARRVMEETPEQFEDHYDLISEGGKRVWADRLQREAIDLPPDRKLSSFTAKFLAEKLAEVGVELSAGRYDNLQRSINVFLSLVGELEIDKLNGVHIENFRNNLLGKINSKKISRAYAKDHLINVKQFYNWLWEKEYIPTLPRNLAKINISVPPTKNPTYPIDELKRLILHAKPMEKLYLLLMCNTGCTQKDISDLRKDEVSKDCLYITRRRSKTTMDKNTPVVKFKLWRETRQLLGAAMKQCKDTTYALCNENGGRLVVRELRKNEEGIQKLWVSDNVACSFYRLCQRLEMKKRPLKLIRKTSATLVKDSEYGDLQTLFLGQSPRTIADKNYTGSITRLDKAIDYLGEKYGIE